MNLRYELPPDILGHVMLSPSLLDAPARLLPVQVLSPVGVLPAHQRRGIGSKLIRQALEIMVERRVPVVFLEGSPAYYSRFGFQPGVGFRKPAVGLPP